MPDIGLLQGAPPRRSRPPSAAEKHAVADAPPKPAAPYSARVDAPAEIVAARYAALPDEAIVVVSAPAPLAEAPPQSTAAQPAPPDVPVERGAAPPLPVRTVAGDVPPIRRSDLLWLALALLAIIGTGIGIRDPWPADEPRFAAIARDMVATGEWLFPRVGGDLYQDKPPLFFWMLAACYAVFGSIRWSFLLPSFLAAGGILFLIYDFGRRLVSRESGLAAALVTVSTLHFVMVMRGAQIDPVLCFMVTFSLYALLRHLLLGPAWGWYVAGGFVAGLGVITKGVGFLPLLVLIPYFALRAFRWQGLAAVQGGTAGWRWWLAPLAMLAGISLWFVPMIVAVDMSGAPEYQAYRDEILFKQTVSRYAAAWHHVKPWYYFVVEVIPALWLPWSLLLFWLVPRFRDAFRARDARVWLPLAWCLLVLLFFSLSPGKRGVYIHVALPALALVSLPVLARVLERRGVRRAGWVLALMFWGAALAAWAALASGVVVLQSNVDLDSLPVRPMLLLYVALAGAGLLVARRYAPLAAWPVAIAALCVAFSYVLAPAMNAERSGSGFVKEMLERVEPEEELALVAYKEQFLLYLDRPTVNFGHRRWLEGPQESYDSAAWLNAGPLRVLLVPEDGLEPCFPAQRTLAGRSSDEDWYLVRAPASSECAAKGNAARAIHYEPKSR
jgi:4-amino-4-deoxy-L-arabinose transferase-like glycosyltransferase